LAVEPEIGLEGGGIPTRIRGPHAGEALTDGAKVVLHCASSDRLAAGVTGKQSDADAVGEDLENFNLVGDGSKEGVLAEDGAESAPNSPVLAGGGGPTRNDAGLGRFFRKAEVTAEIMLGRRGQRTQGKGCGYVELK
jgi:hypothetical protein